MESVTLQTNNTIVVAGSRLGQVQFAASAESDSGAARLVAARIFAQGEGAFTSVSNPTSLIFATAGPDANGAVDRLRISESGHFLPIVNNQYSIGQPSAKFLESYAVSGIFDEVKIASVGGKVLSSMLYLDQDRVVQTFQNIRISTEDLSSPALVFKASGTLTPDISLNVLTTATNVASGVQTLSFRGSAGELFSITDVLNTGTIFSVNDISGLELIAADADGTVRLVKFGTNVAVGNVTPTQKLHVAGNLRVEGQFYDSLNSPGASGEVLVSTVNGTDWRALSEIAGVDGVGVANYIARWSDADTIGTGLLFDNGTGVGVGTTSPTARLHLNIASSTATGVIVRGAASQSASLQQWQNSSAAALAEVTSAGNLQFRASATGVAATQIPVFTADPASTTRLLVTRTPTQLRSDIGAGTGNGTVTSIATNDGLTGGTITTTGTLGLTGQALALHNLATNGLITRTGVGTVAGRTITGTANQVTVTNGDGVAGNPTLSLPQNIHTAATPTFGATTVNGTIGIRASSTASVSTQIPVFTADPTSTTRVITTRTPAQLRSDIGAGTGNGTVTSIATNNGITGGTITGAGTIGLDGQALALHNLATNGVIVRTGAGTVAGRTITGTTNQVTVTNGDGVAGNPTLSLPQNIHTAATPTFGATTINGNIGIRAAATATTSTQIPVFIADPSSTTRTIVTRTPAQLRSDIGAGTGNGTVTSIATNNGITGGTITSAGTVGLDGQALALHNLATNGLIARTGAGTVAGRTLTGTANQVTVTNGDGVAGNPTLSLPQNIHTAATPTFGGGTLNGALNLRASATGVAATQIPVFTADPASTTRLLVTRTPAQILSDIGAQAALTDPVTGTGLKGQVSFWSGATTQDGDDNLFWDNSNKRLGVGTSSPASSVDINGNTTVRGDGQLFSLESTGSPYIRFNMGGSATTGTYLVQSWGSSRVFSFEGMGDVQVVIDENNNMTDKSFIVRHNGTSGPELFRVQENGLIGIGTTSPEARLHINTSSTTATGVIVRGAASQSADLQQWQNSSATALASVSAGGSLSLRAAATGVAATQIPVFTADPSATTRLLVTRTPAQLLGDIGGIGGTGLSGRVSFWSGASTQSSDANLFWDNTNKRLGVGTSSPQHLVDVSGTLRADHITAITKSFLIEHPTKPGRQLRYASLEGPENGVYFRGSSAVDVIELPEYWTELVDEDTITVNLTPVGIYQSLYVKSKTAKEIKVGGLESGAYDFVVYAERKDVSRLEVEC